MRLLYCVSLLLLFFASNIFAQTSGPNLVWQRTLGGSGYDSVAGHRLTSDSGFIVLGTTESSDGDVAINKGGKDIWVVKLDAKRNIVWQRTIGGSGEDKASFIENTSNSGFIITGRTTSTDGDLAGVTGIGNCLVVKLDSNGAIEWKRRISTSDNDRVTSIEQTRDGGYIMIGNGLGTAKPNHGGQDVVVSKLDALGNIVWQKWYGGSSLDGGNEIHQTLDGGYVFCGRTWSKDGDIDTSLIDGGRKGDWIVKLNDTGAIKWQRFVHSGWYYGLSSIKELRKGGFIAIGTSQSFGGDYDYLLVRLDSAGTVTLDATYGGTGYQEGTGVKEQLSGYVIHGISYQDGDTANHGGTDLNILRISDSGKVMWKKSFGGSRYEWPSPSIMRGALGGLLYSAMTESNNGNVSGNHGNADIWLIFAAGGDASGGVNEQPITSVLLYPNPTNNLLYIEGDLPSSRLVITITNALGIPISESATYSREIDISRLVSGAYYVTISDGKHVLAREKFIKE